ncbi:alpha/beta fold hydrolase [Sorangium sp. So ce1182]|uniref:alpha/beta fold hydrolase n=1 Tax=Sorangium sp. So ce1182 TaxID=3133334 RepID=UPI003F608C76
MSMTTASLVGHGGPDGALTPRFMEVNGARLACVEQGQGTPVVFLHGAVSDHRMWDRHRAIVGERHRAIAYSQRYFGTGEWGSSWPPLGVQTHTDDLVAFLRGLGAGPAHVVAWSYAGHVVLSAALTHPELIRSAFIYEPGVPSYVTDPAELSALRDDVNAMFGPIFGAVQRGDSKEAVRLLLDGSGQREGYFDAQSAERQTVNLDNARTMPLLLSQPRPPEITCGQLASLKVPVTIAHGELSRPTFGVVSRAAARCIPGQHLVVPGATHMWPEEDAAAFCAAVLSRIKER